MVGSLYTERKEGVLPHVDEVVIVTDEEVPQYPSFVQVAQANHVLDSIHGSCVHGSDLGGGLDPVLLFRISI